MRLANAIAIVPGLWLLGVVIVLGILTTNNPSPFLVTLFGLATVALVPTGSELCRFALSSGDNEHHFFSGGYRACIVDIMIMVLAICLTAATANYQRPSRLFCDGRVSAGFPVAFICDASGESPLSSVGIVNWADLDSINILGSLVDVLFYMMLLRIGRLALHRQ